MVRQNVGFTVVTPATKRTKEIINQSVKSVKSVKGVSSKEVILLEFDEASLLASKVAYDM